LQKCGYDVLLVGRLRKNSLPMETRSYSVRRLTLWFNAQAFFYAELNIRFFFLLLFKKPDLIFVNDLDTLPAGFLASLILRRSLIYDSHEYFTEVPELQKHPFARKVWLTIEQGILPKLKNSITVNQSIADIYNRKYNINMIAVRNVPFRKTKVVNISRTELNLPENKSILILQGTGINVDRGAEELVIAMQWVSNAILLIVGGGDVFPHLSMLIGEYKLEERVKLLPKQSAERLHLITSIADLGMSMDKNTNPNYFFSLPNKLFDYIQARIPVLASNFPEIAFVINKYQVGFLFDDHDPRSLANTINNCLMNQNQLASYRINSEKAANELCWENEELLLIEVIQRS
jgi:glycosyltransferase involved in cell wall biosynthesis